MRNLTFFIILLTIPLSSFALDATYYRDTAAQSQFQTQTIQLLTITPEVEKLLAERNPQWQLTRRWPAQMELQRIYAVTHDPATGQIYFLTDDGFDFQVQQLNRDFSLSLLATYPLYPFHPDTGMPTFQLSVDEKSIIITTNEEILAVRRPGKRLWQIKNLPSRVIHAFQAAERMIIVGKREVISCDFRGGEREVLISGSQQRRMLEIQRKNPEITIAQAWPGIAPDELLLQLNTPQRELAGLWRFSLKTRKESKLLTLPFHPKHPMLRTPIDLQRFGDTLFLTVGMRQAGFPLQFGQYDLTNQTLSIPAARDYAVTDSAPVNTSQVTPKLMLPPELLIGGACFRQDNTLYCAGWPNLPEQSHDPIRQPGVSSIIDLELFPDGPVWQYPKVLGFYPGFEPGSVLIVEYGRITELRKR